MTVTPSQFDLLGRLLDATALRHQVIARNVANVNTPGYRQLEVTFEDRLARQLSSSGHGQEALVNPEVRESEGLSSRTNGNNVDVDVQMGQLNKNALLYETYALVLSSKLAMMRSAITGQ